MVFRSCVCLVVFCCGLTPQAFAESVYKANVRAELISDVTTIEPGHTFWVGLQMTMDEGWHTYWRNSGDSGLPTHIQWYLPKGFGAGSNQYTVLVIKACAGLNPNGFKAPNQMKIIPNDMRKNKRPLHSIHCAIAESILSHRGKKLDLKGINITD